MHQMSGAGGEETSSLVSFYGLVLLVVLIDQLTKFFVLAWLPADDSVSVIPGVFHLTLVHNSGIAFGVFRRQETLLLILITLSLAVLIVLGHRICRHKASLLAWTGLALILGGAIGNWIDRLRFRAVIDFLDFRIWPVFNVADSAITVGVLLYLLLFFKNREEKPAA